MNHDHLKFLEGLVESAAYNVEMRERNMRHLPYFTPPFLALLPAGLAWVVCALIWYPAWWIPPVVWAISWWQFFNHFAADRRIELVAATNNHIHALASLQAYKARMETEQVKQSIVDPTPIKDERDDIIRKLSISLAQKDAEIFRLKHQTD